MIPMEGQATISLDVLLDPYKKRNQNPESLPLLSAQVNLGAF